MTNIPRWEINSQNKDKKTQPPIVIVVWIMFIILHVSRDISLTIEQIRLIFLQVWYSVLNKNNFYLIWNPNNLSCRIGVIKRWLEDEIATFFIKLNNLNLSMHKWRELEARFSTLYSRYYTKEWNLNNHLKIMFVNW